MKQDLTNGYLLGAGLLKGVFDNESQAGNH